MQYYFVEHFPENCKKTQNNLNNIKYLIDYYFIKWFLGSKKNIKINNVFKKKIFSIVHG